MTRDRKRKQEVRALQRETGRRYTPLAREAAARKSYAGEAFSLGSLLAECTSAPVTVPALFKDVSEWDPPQAFSSELLGVDVPHGTVLELAGLLALPGLATEVRVESTDPEHQVVVAAEGRRFELCLTQERVDECCRQPNCPRSPSGQDIIWCAEHVHERELPELVEMARRVGYTTKDEAGYDPDRCGGGVGADLLVKAAVARAGSSAVIEALIDAGFDDPDLADEWSSDRGLEMRIRHAIDRERLRLDGVAQAEARRIGKAAGACPTCGDTFRPGRLSSHFRPQFCSRTCDPEPPAQGVPGSAPSWL